MQTHSQTEPAAASSGLFAAVLAAGSATRFGGRKQLASFGGQSLVERAIRTAESWFGANTLLVAGCEWQEVHAACAPLAGFLVRNEHYKSGMAGSIAAAVRVLPDSATGLVLLLADQALIGDVELQELIAEWLLRPEKIVCCEFDDVRGPPAIFPRAFFAELADLAGDRGARAIIERNPNQVSAVHCEHAAIDIDTPEDLRNLAQ